MIEFPEAIVLAGQLDKELTGKRILSAVRGNSPHKFVFYSYSAEEYAAILSGKVVGGVTASGNMIQISLEHSSTEPGYLLVLGEGGEHIFYHTSEKTLPKKHQLLLQFADQTYLTVSVQGWGAAKLLNREEAAQDAYVGKKGVSPLSPEFSQAYFQSLFDGLKEGEKASVKYFLISEPGIWGMGNGCLQDILFNARIHPRRRAVSLDEAERARLYEALRTTLKEMVDGGGRDTELDIYGQAGKYPKILKSTSAGTPCPRCGTPIEKAAFLGGAVYYCPTCQVNS